MKDKQMIVLVDDEFLDKVEYLRKINDFKNKSETVRKTIEKEYRKEKTEIVDDDVCIGCENKRFCDKQSWYYRSFNKANCERQEKEKDK